MPDTLTSIRNALDSLRNSEKKVAKCVLADPSAAINYSITELAEKAGTSEATVVRFCRSLGLAGYLELRLNLAREMPSAQPIFENVAASDSLAEITGKILGAHKEALSNALNKLNLDDLDQAVKLLAAARSIDFYGVGGSAIVAKDAHHKFFRLGIPCAAYDDPHMQVMSAAQLAPGCVVVAISHTGSTKDIIESARIARAAGAKVIGVVGKNNSPLARVCDLVLSVHSQEAALLLAPMTSRLVQLAIIDVLFVAVAMQDFGGVKERLDRVKRSLVEKRY
ncbi:MAG: MurR/RpiR family transcriptional regulator [Thermodesulfobacteriota bacterium]